MASYAIQKPNGVSVHHVERACKKQSIVESRFFEFPRETNEGKNVVFDLKKETNLGSSSREFRKIEGSINRYSTME